MVKSIRDILEKYRTSTRIIKRKDVLLDSYLPESLEEVLHRDREIEEITRHLLPILDGEKVSNLLILGKPGTGKTLITKLILKELEVYSKGSIRGIYVNVRLKGLADTPYRILAYILRNVGVDVPYTGLSFNRIYELFVDYFNNHNQNIILALDEIDELATKKKLDVLRTLVLLQHEIKNSTLTIIGISNNLRFTEKLESKIKLSFSEEILFNPYTSEQLFDILKKRAELALNPDSYDNKILMKIATIAARDDGNARTAINLLRISAEIAERARRKRILPEDVDRAVVLLEEGQIVETIRNLPLHMQILLKALFTLIKQKEEKNEEPVATTKEVYNKYVALCNILGATPRTQRRVNDWINELTDMGIIDSEIKSEGRYGRKRYIKVTIDTNLRNKIERMLNETLGLNRLL